MSERLKYALNGVYRCENFAQHLANNDFPTVPIGSAGEFDVWNIMLKIKPDNAAVVYPFIYSNTVDTELGTKRLFSVVKKDGSRSFLKESFTHLKVNYGPVGLEMNILELLNEKNGYLDDGALMIEYGFQVESILGMDNIWRFNTNDLIFDCQQKKNMIRIQSPSYSDSHVHKQLLTFHSSYYKRNCEENDGTFEETVYDGGALENFLQICQGVHVKNLDERSLGRILNVAFRYSFHNVFHYCERQLTENDLELDHRRSWVIHWNGLRHYLVHLLKKVKSPRELIKKKKYIRKMPGETMKMFIAKFLYNKF